ncbi:MFS transporter [Nocardioides sp. 1609]|uniref:MFS transporter n=1 Tax=Nocardioides sp. 1609 TaxID=2508327 RepID=UPI0010701D55|nr:MFS transporter [Nocardioides sp. 1609]
MSSTATPAATRPSRLPLAVYVLAAGTFLMGTTEFVVAGLLPELADDFSTTEAGAGLSITVFAIGMILGSPVMPMLTLRLPQRTTLTLALAVYAVAHLVSALTASFAVLLVTRFVAAVATGTFWAVAAVAAVALAGSRRSSTALGLVLGGGMLSTVVGVPLGAVGGQLVGWRGPFWCLAVLAAVTAVAVARLVPPRSGAAATPSIRSELSALRSGRLWAVLLTCAAVTASVLSVYSFVSPLFTGRAGMSPALVPLALVLFGTGAFVGNLVGGRWGDRRPLTTIVGAAAVSLVASAVLCLVSTSVVPALLAFALLGLVGLSANPVLVSLAVRLGGEGATLPSAMATSMFNLGTAVGTAVTGALLGTSFGTLSPPVVGVAFGVLVLVPLTFVVLGRPRSTGGDEAAHPGRDDQELVTTGCSS